MYSRGASQNSKQPQPCPADHEEASSGLRRVMVCLDISHLQDNIFYIYVLWDHKEKKQNQEETKGTIPLVQIGKTRLYTNSLLN